MKKNNKPHFIAVLTLTVLASGLLAQPSRADTIIHESATLGNTNPHAGVGISVNVAQFLGPRFHVEQRTQITAVGGHLWNSGSNTFFAAILALSGPDALPTGSPINPSEVAASTVFDPGRIYGDFSTPLSVILEPGYYGLVFGTDELGASGGDGIMPTNQKDNLDQPSYFRWDLHAGSAGSIWKNSSDYYPRRFIVKEIILNNGGMYGGGRGTAAEPYLIYTAEQMNAIGDNQNDWDKHFKLMANIDLACYDGQNGRPTFNVIGYSNIYSYDPPTKPFTGVFDGNGYAIANFTFSKYSANGTAIFRYIDSTQAEIRDLKLITPNIQAGSIYTAALVGRLESGTIKNCSVKAGSISGDDYVGGLVGDNWGDIYQCYSTCSVDGNNHIGGITGRNAGSIHESYATGNIDGNVLVGGLVGRNSNAFGSDGYMSDTYALGTVTGSSSVGGLVGQNWGGSVNFSYAAGPVSGSADVGGLIGGCVANGHCSNSFWDSETAGQFASAGGTRKNTGQMHTQSTFVGWDFTTPIWTICENANYPRLTWSLFRGDIICPDGVDFVDFALFANNWFQINCGNCGGADLTDDGQVNMMDMEQFAHNWLKGK